MSVEDRWLQKALIEAQRAERLGEVPVGALVVQNNKVISIAFNSKENKNNPCGHAEILALSKAARRLKSWRLSGCTLVVTLEPCPMCLAACQQARITKLIYGCKDPKGGALSLGYSLHQDKRLNHQFEALFLETPECGKILTRFFKKKRQKGPFQKGEFYSLLAQSLL